jgi:hypothetical protein
MRPLHLHAAHVTVCGGFPCEPAAHSTRRFTGYTAVGTEIALYRSGVGDRRWRRRPCGGYFLGTILTKETTTKMAWGDDDWSTLYYTTRHILARMRLKIPSVPVLRGLL